MGNTRISPHGRRGAGIRGQTKKRHFAIFYSAISGLIPRRSAAAQVMQRLQRFGIKPDGIINFLTERASVQTNTTLKIPRGLPRGGSFFYSSLEDL
jgi:hypothetical protein